MPSTSASSAALEEGAAAANASAASGEQQQVRQHPLSTEGMTAVQRGFYRVSLPNLPSLGLVIRRPQSSDRASERWTVTNKGPIPSDPTHKQTNKQTKVGRFAARRPWRVGAACALVSVLCGLGLLRVVVETSPQVGLCPLALLERFCMD